MAKPWQQAESSNKTCYILVGMIASGKSTYSQKKAANGNCVIINDDALVTALHGGLYTQYDKRLKPLYKAVEVCIFTTAATLGLDIVIDRGLNISSLARLRWLGLAKSFDYSVAAVVFNKYGAEIHAYRRTFQSGDNRGRDYDHWLKAAQRHEQLWQEPTLSEGFDVIDYENYKV